MDDQLQVALIEQLNSNWQSNPALTTLIHDYTKYHTVLVIMGGIVLLISTILTIMSWIRFKKAPKISRLKWPFEKKIYFFFGSTLTMFSLFFALVWVANLSTALNPLPGFTSLVNTTAVSGNSNNGKALINWAQSGSTTPPPTLQEKVQERINWQRPKAIVCGLLLIIFTVLNIRIWSNLIKKSRINEAKWSPRDRLVIFTGAITYVCTLLLAIMSVANAQGAIGPIVISLLGS